MTNGLDAAPQSGDVPVGRVIHRWRRNANLTGAQLAGRVGMSQAKVSRVETGATVPGPVDIRKIGRALNVPDDEIEWLVVRAEQIQDADFLTDWRPGTAGLAAKQVEVGKLEQKAREFRIFQPAVVPGLLQSDGYARAVMATPQRMLADAAADHSAAALQVAVGERIKRQEILNRPQKQFYFVMTESALSNRLGTPEDMIGQIRRLREVARQNNVSLGIIPADTVLTDPPIHGFEVLDEQWLFIDLFNTSLTSRGASDIQVHRQLFDRMQGIASLDIDRILDRYAALYLRLSG